MTSQTQHTPATTPLSNLFSRTIYGMPLTLFIPLLGIVLIAHFTGRLPNQLAGGFAFMFVVGAIFGEIGKSLPYFNKYIGGAPVMIFLVTAFLVDQNWLNESEIKAVTGIMKDAGYLNFYIAILITGSIFMVKRQLLIKSLLGYIPTILAGVLGAALLGVIGGMIFGIPLDRTLMLYVLPIMGGGNGAGAVPLSEIYEAVTGNSKQEYYSVAIAILTIANIIAIIAAALLSGVGQRFPSLTGNGELLKNNSGLDKIIDDDETEQRITARDVAIGMMLAACFYTFSYVLSKDLLPGFGNVKIHTFAYMVILVSMANIFGWVPETMKAGAVKLSDFFIKQLLWPLMVGVGLAYTDLSVILNALTITNVMMAALIVFGAILGSALGGRMMGFFPIESSITAGLCMANRGGSGDLEVLAASNRMSLLSYAQLSSRIGGGIVLIISSVAFGVLSS